MHIVALALNNSCFLVQIVWLWINKIWKNTRLEYKPLTQVLNFRRDSQPSSTCLTYWLTWSDVKKGYLSWHLFSSKKSFEFISALCNHWNPIQSYIFAISRICKHALYKLAKGFWLHCKNKENNFKVRLQ